MDALFSAIVNNPAVTFVAGTPILVFIGFAIYKGLLKIVLSEKNIHTVAAAVDKYIDKIQKKNPGAGKETREKLIKTFQEIIKELKASDGVN